MKFIIEKSKANINPVEFMRRAGYFHIHDKRRRKDSFVRRLGRDNYPRMHMYIDQFKSKKTGEELMSFNLHMDQKKPSYKGSHMHNAEYDGPIIESEIGRIKTLLGENIGDAGEITSSRVKGQKTRVGGGKKDFKSNRKQGTSQSFFGKLLSVFKSN